MTARPRRNASGRSEYRAGRRARVTIWIRAPRAKSVERVKESLIKNYKWLVRTSVLGWRCGACPWESGLGTRCAYLQRGKQVSCPGLELRLA